MSSVDRLGFDYAVLSPALAGDAREAATRIKSRMARAASDIIEIGRDLISVKASVGHGHFMKWIAAEFNMSADTAGRFMSVATRLADKIPHGAEFAPTVLYALAAKQTSDEVIEDVVDRVARGELVTATEIKLMRRGDPSPKPALSKGAGTPLTDILKQALDVVRAWEVARPEARDIFLNKLRDQGTIGQLV